MTRIDATNIAELQRISGKSILFDANIWLHIEGPTAGPSENLTKVYSTAYKVLRRNNVIVVNQYVLAEFYNRYLKLEYEFAKELAGGRSFPNFKQYRSDSSFTCCLEGARDTVLNFIDDCEFMAVTNSVSAFSGAIAEASRGELDLNDVLIHEDCSCHGHHIMTHDGDFRNCTVPLITANRKLLF